MRMNGAIEYPVVHGNDNDEINIVKWLNDQFEEVWDDPNFKYNVPFSFYYVNSKAFSINLQLSREVLDGIFQSLRDFDVEVAEWEKVYWYRRNGHVPPNGRDYTEVIKRGRKWANKFYYSQSEYCSKYKFSRNWLSNVINGKTYPKRDLLLRMCYCFRFDIETVYGILESYGQTLFCVNMRDLIIDTHISNSLWSIDDLEFELKKYKCTSLFT